MVNEIENLYKELARGKFGVGPEVTDQAKVLKAINDTIQEWNIKKRNPAFAAEAPKRQKILQDMKAKIQQDPSFITIQSKAYAEIEKMERQEKEKEIRQMAKIYVDGNGEIAQEMLTQLANRTKLKQDDILRILGAKIKKKREFKYKDDGVAELDAVTMRGINTQLNTLGKKSLYEFLGVNQKASDSQIKAEVDKIRRMVSGAAEKTDEITAKGVLCGHVDNVLLKPDKRKNYDKALDNLSFTSVRDKMQLMKAAHSTVLSSSQYLALLEECTKAGMSKDKAEYLIITEADKLGLAVADESSSTGNMTQCRFCGSLSSKGDSVCHSCGMPFKVKCPSCGKQTGDEDLKCTSCGFSIADMPKARLYISMAETAIINNNLNEAISNQKMAMTLWPNCPDLKKITDKLGSIAPDAPTDLKAELQGNIIRLSWMKIESAHLSCSYVVVRKEGARPSGPNDGQTIGTTSNGGYDDNTTQAGLSYYYAVYAKNGNTLSRSAAVTAKPLMRVDELDTSLLKVDIQETSINFSCNIPRGMSAIEIYRDNQHVKTLTGASFLDDGLTTRRTYSYRFVAVYKDTAQNEHKSKGVTLQFTPQPKPKAVELQLRDSDLKAQLSWAPPSNGVLSIYYDDKPFPYNINDIVNLDTFKAQRLNVAGTTCIVNKDFSGERYFLPVTVQGNIGVAGRQVSVLSISELKNVDYSLDGRTVTVSWSWDNTSAVQLCYSIGSMNSKTMELDRSTAAKPQYVINIPDGAKSISLSLMSAVKTAMGMRYGKPSEKVFNLQNVKVQFSNAQSRAMFGLFSKNKYSITVNTDQPLPCDLHLLIQENFPPTDLVNYRTRGIIKKQDLKPGEPLTLELTYDKMQKSAQLHFRLIAAVKELRPQVSIIPETRIVK